MLICEVRSGNAVAYVYDDAYRDATPEEMERRRRSLGEAIGKIAVTPGAAERLEEYRKREAARPADDSTVIWMAKDEQAPD